MPDNLPTHPDFGYFTERPDQRLSDDVNDFHQAEPPDLEYTLPGLPALVYPIRQDDAADEVERLRIQLEHVKRIMVILEEHRKEYARRSYIPTGEGGEYWKGRRDEAGWAYDRLIEFSDSDKPDALLTQLNAARAEFIRIYPPLPVFMQERLEGLRVLLGVER